MEFKDYYKTLGVEKTATPQEIKKAYRRLARETHPDVNQDDAQAAERFREINEANEVLSDPEKRKKYDEVGPRWRDYEAWQKAGGEATGVPFDASGMSGAGRGAPNGNYNYQSVNIEDLEDLFGNDTPFSSFFYSNFGDNGGTSDIFGGAGASTRPRKGGDYEQAVSVTLDEAYTGGKRLMELSEPAADGSGVKTRRIEVTIPAGVGDGQRIRITGAGGPGRNGGANGDLYLAVRVLANATFAREGDDVRVKLPIPLLTALLGGEVLVPTLKGGKLALKIPAETQNGKVFRLRGQGMPHLGKSGAYGDLLAEANVALPTGLTDAEKALLGEWARLRDGAAGQPVA